MVRRPNNKKNSLREYVLSLGNGVNLVIPENMVDLRNRCLQEMIAVSKDTIPKSILKCGECPWSEVKIGNNLLCTYPELDQLCVINMKNKEGNVCSSKDQKAKDNFKRSAYSISKSTRMHDK